MIFLISSVSVVISPFLFPILLIWILSLFPLISLAKGLSILLIFLKNQLFVAIVKGVSSLTSFSACLSFDYRKDSDLLELIL